jgi:hypothetical protein
MTGCPRLPRGIRTLETSQIFNCMCTWGSYECWNMMVVWDIRLVWSISVLNTWDSLGHPICVYLKHAEVIKHHVSPELRSGCESTPRKLSRILYDYIVHLNVPEHSYTQLIGWFRQSEFSIPYGHSHILIHNWADIPLTLLHSFTLLHTPGRMFQTIQIILYTLLQHSNRTLHIVCSRHGNATQPCFPWHILLLADRAKDMRVPKCVWKLADIPSMLHWMEA